MSRLIKSASFGLDSRSLLPIPHGECDGGDCDRPAVSFAYDEQSSALIPVCRRHILVYEVGPRHTSRRFWQAEDEYAELRFARRSRWRWLAQRRILHDQRVAVRGGESRAQRTRRLRADRAVS